MANVDLNLRASSNMVAFNKSSNFGMMNNFLQGTNSHLASSKNLVSQSQYTDMNDYFLLKEKVAELTQSLSREMEAVRILENKCTEYISQFDQAGKVVEDLKIKNFEEKREFQDQISTLEQRIKELNDKISSQDKERDANIEEISKLKKKMNMELESRGHLLDENDELQRRLEILMKSDKENDIILSQKDEDIRKLRKQIDADRIEIERLRIAEERYTQHIKEITYRNDDLEVRSQDLGKTIDDQNQSINIMRLENDGLKNNLRVMNGQYRDMLSENEHLKGEVLRLKGNLLEVEGDWKTSQMSLDRANVEIRQIKEALKRTENAFERERDARSQLAASVSQRPTVNFSSDFEPKPASYYEPSTTSRKVTIDEDNSYNRNERRRVPEEPKPARRQDQSSSRFISDLDDNKLNKTQTYSNNNNYQNDYLNQSISTYNPPPRRDHQRSATNIQPYPAQNLNIEDYSAPYSNKRERLATTGNDYEVRRSTQETEKQSRGGYSRNDNRSGREDYQQPEPRNDNRGAREDYQQQSRYEPRSTKHVNESHIVFGTNQEIGKSPASKPRERTRSPEREGQAAGRPTNTGYEEHKHGIKSDGYTQKGTTNLLAWVQPPADESRSRGNSPDKRMYSQTMSYQKKEEPVNERNRLNSTMNKGAREESSMRQGRREERNEYGGGSRQTSKDTRNLKSEIQQIQQGDDRVEIEVLERKLTQLQIQRDNLNDELIKLEKIKVKSNASIKKNQELGDEMNYLKTNISNIKNRLRDLKALHN